MEWKKVKLGDILKITGGQLYKGDLLGTGDNLLLGMGCVSFLEKFLMKGARQYGGDCLDKNIGRPGDIVLATRQQSDNLPILAMPAIIPEGLPAKKIIIGSNLYKVNVIDSDFDNRFIYWLLKTPEYVNYISSVKTGTTVKMITIKDVENYTFLCPPKESRDKISKLLWDLDDKIENNNRINRNLEAQAQALFKSWFVDFEPWGGTMPDDWKEGTLGEICSFNKRKVGPKFANPIQYLDTGHLTEGVIEGYQRFNPGDKIPSSARRYVGEGDILFSLCRPNMRHYGLMMNPPENIVASTGFAVITANWSGYRYYIYQWLKQDGIIDNIHAVAEQSSTTYPTIDVDYLAGMTMVIPSIADTERYAHLCCDLYSKIESNYQENLRLAALRDTLLPKLMRGEIAL